MNLPPTKGKFTLEKETQRSNLKENNLPQYVLFWFHKFFFTYCGSSRVCKGYSATSS
jgi:hypothetical protein